MRDRWRLTGVARLVGTSYFVLTSLCCLLYFMPFTYVQLLESELVPAAVFFERTHAWLFLPIVLLIDVSLRHTERSPGARRVRQAFRVTMLIVGVALLVRPVLPELENTLSSFVWSQLALIPVFWAAGVDLAAAKGRIRWSSAKTAGEGRVLTAAVGAAGFSWLLSATIVAARTGAGDALTGTELVIVSAWSLAAHLTLFLGACACLLLVRGISAMTRTPGRVEALALSLLSTLVLAVAIKRTIFAGLAFTGTLADLAAVTLAMSVVMTVLRGAARTWLGGPEPVVDGFAGVLGSLVPCVEASRTLVLGWLGALAVGAWLLMGTLAEIDWNYLLQRSLIMTVWVAAFAACYVIARPRRHHTRGVMAAFVMPLCALGLFRGVGPASRPVLESTTEGRTLSTLLERYAGHDVSAGLLAGWLQRGPARSEDELELFNYLQAYTGIPRSVELTAPAVAFVDDVSPTGGARPNIFIIVVDSLRRDYLGVYNPDVKFMPAIDQFASDSLVFEQAFSRYGATGLSEPSIWVGGMLPHQQYVSPFAPMNSMQRLLRAQDYQGFISVDPILDKILEPESWVTELDHGRQAGEIELCQSLGVLRGELSARHDRSAPVFMYTQPQNIHIATIARGAGTTVGEGQYEGFHAPYASRLHQLDTCFGSFIDYLKAEGLYETSVVVLTSDHGDSLGEGGRFGHAYTIFPEILRIPLVMRVPAQLTVGLGVNPAGLAFSTDLSPTLHTLLGFAPAAKGPGVGRSLFTRRADERRDYVSADHLVASSYGPVYGLISDQGRSLYILDGVNYRDYLYDLTTESNTTSTEIGADQRRAARATIRRMLDELNDWYGVPQLH